MTAITRLSLCAQLSPSPYSLYPNLGGSARAYDFESIPPPHLKGPAIILPLQNWLEVSNVSQTYTQAVAFASLRLAENMVWERHLVALSCITTCYFKPHTWTGGCHCTHQDYSRSFKVFPHYIVTLKWLKVVYCRCTSFERSGPIINIHNSNGYSKCKEA